MKFFFIITLILTLQYCGFAQIQPLSDSMIMAPKNTDSDCDKNVVLDEDKMTGHKTYIGKELIEIKSNNKLAMNILTILSEDKKTISISFVAKQSISCVDESDMVFFLFKDGTRNSLAGIQSFNCQGMFFLYFGEHASNSELLNMLISKKIATIRLQTDTQILDADLSTQNSNVFYNQINCLIKMRK